MIVHSTGHLLVSGNFAGTVDFDPGTGVHEASAPSNETISYLIRLDGTGNFNWLQTLNGIDIRPESNCIVLAQEREKGSRLMF